MIRPSVSGVSIKASTVTDNLTWTGTAAVGKKLIVWVRGTEADFTGAYTETCFFGAVEMRQLNKTSYADTVFAGIHGFILDDPIPGADTISFTTDNIGGTWQGINFSIVNGGEPVMMGSYYSDIGSTLTKYGYAWDSDGLMVAIFWAGSSPTITGGTEFASGTGVKANYINGNNSNISFACTRSGGGQKLLLTFLIPALHPVIGGCYQPFLTGQTSIASLAAGSGVHVSFPHGGGISGAGRQGNMVPVAGTIRSIAARISDPPGAGKSVTVYLMSGGTSDSVGGIGMSYSMYTGHSFTISDPATEGSLDNVDLAVYRYQRLTWRYENSGAGALPSGLTIVASAMFESGDGSQAYGGGPMTFGQTGTLNLKTRRAPLHPDDTAWDNFSSIEQSLFGVAGTISEYIVNWQSYDSASPGIHFDFYLELNGVIQDGTGGTVDTFCQYVVDSTGQALARKQFTLPIAVGDVVSVVQYLRSFAGSELRHSPTIVFTPTTPEEFLLSGTTLAFASGTIYMMPNDSRNFETTAADEDEYSLIIPPLPAGSHLYITGMRAKLNVAPGSTKSFTYTLRKNIADSALPALVLSNAEVVDSVSGSAEFVAGDEMAVKRLATNFPTDPGKENWALTGLMTPVTNELLRVTQVVLLVGTDETVEPVEPADPCAGGGTTPSGTNPSAGTSFDDALSPEFYLEIDVAGASPTTERMAKGPMPDAASYKEPRVLTFGEVRYELGDHTGMPAAASLESIVADTDRLFRAYMDQLWTGASSTDALLDTAVRLYGRANAAATPELFWQGRIRDYKPNSNMSFRLTSEDALSILSTSRNHDEKLVPTLFTNDVADGTPIERMKDKPIPLAYGSLSDEDQGEDAVGVVPFPYTMQTSQFWPAYLPRSVDFYLGCLGGVSNIQHVFGADYRSSSDEPTSRSRIPDEAWGDWAWAPFKPGWPFPDNWVEVNGVRYTAVILEQNHIVSRLAREGRIPLTVNLCGYAGANGLMMDTLEDIFLHFLINFGYGSYEGVGAFAAAVPSLGSYSAIDTASFTASKTATINMRGSTIKGAALIAWDYQQRTLNQLIAQFCQSLGVDPGTNQYGQFMISRLDRTVAVSGTARTDLEHHIKGSFQQTPQTRRRLNLARYVYARNYVATLAGIQPPEGARGYRPPYDGEWMSGLLTWPLVPTGRIASDVLYFEMLRDSGDAMWVASQYFDMYGMPRSEVEWTERLGAIALKLGQVVPVTNYKGSGAAGWTERPVRIRKQVVRADKPLTVKITATDVLDLLGAPSNGLGWDLEDLTWDAVSLTWT